MAAVCKLWYFYSTLFNFIVYYLFVWPTKLTKFS